MPKIKAKRQNLTPCNYLIINIINKYLTNKKQLLFSFDINQL